MNMVEVFEACQPEFTCKYCGSPSYLAPSEQSPPPDYCHESDHGEPEEHAFAYFIDGPQCGGILAYPNDVENKIRAHCRLYGHDESEYTATPLVPQARTIASGLGLSVEQVQSDLDGAPKYNGPSIPNTLADCAQNLASGMKWTQGNHRVVIDMAVQGEGWVLERGVVYSFGKEQPPKLHAKPFPDKPDCVAAFKKWYWDHGAHWNAADVRPVWMAAQHAMYEALKEQMS